MLFFKCAALNRRPQSFTPSDARFRAERSFNLRLSSPRCASAEVLPHPRPLGGAGTVPPPALHPRTARTAPHAAPGPPRSGACGAASPAAPQLHAVKMAPDEGEVVPGLRPVTHRGAGRRGGAQLGTPRAAAPLGPARAAGGAGTTLLRASAAT